MSPSPEFTQIRLEIDEPIARITMDRPRYRNAQSRILREELDEAFELCRHDDAVKVVVLLGAGEHFSAGHDLGTPEERADLAERPVADDIRARFRRSHMFNVENTMRWRDFPKPTIAAVQGYCIFAGWMVASAMDVVIASDDAEFLPEFVQFFTMPWDVAPRRAKEILFEGRFVSAEEAHELGFVNRVVPRDQLEATAMEMARTWAENDLARLEIIKEGVNGIADAQGFRASIEASFMRHQLLQETERMAGIAVATESDGRRHRPRADRAFAKLRARREGDSQ